ncbi:hypothetical protein [Natronorubrum sp. FCH18a]|uniref:hypothetical protein n=1 Tax=Natronorubrum sp. FCH18a TaxID=3447018 RepID=UPI003F51227C
MIDPLYAAIGVAMAVTLVGITLWLATARGPDPDELRVRPDDDVADIEDDLEDVFDSNEPETQASSEETEQRETGDETADKPMDDSDPFEQADGEDTDPDATLRERLQSGVRGLFNPLFAAILWLIARVRGFATMVRYRLKQTVVGALMGGSHPNTARLELLVVVSSGLVAGIGLFALIYRGVETSASSAPVISTIFGLAGNSWVWVLVIALLFRSLLFFGDRLLARVTASTSGYRYNTVRRLAEEAKQPDLDSCERVLVQSGDSASEIASWLVNAFDGTGHANPTFSPPEESGNGDEAASSVASETRETSGREAAGQLPAVESEPIDVSPPTDDTEGGSDQNADSDPDFWTQYRLFRLELASAIDLNGVLWRFLVPALLAFVTIMLWVQIWVQPWYLPVILAVSVFVGGGYYWAVDLRHRRRLRALRDENEPTQWTDLAILTKTVDVPETTMYFGYHDGKTYASEDKYELARTLADRAIDRLEGRQPAPALEEKNAYLLKRYIPMLEAWKEEREKAAIMDQLVNGIANTSEGLIPRDLLIQDVVEYDRRYVAWGLLFIGRGRDPSLVREVYADLVQAHALVETPVTIKDTEHGEERDITAVSLGDEPLPPNVAQLRGEFSSLFGKQALNTRYKAPDVDVSTKPAPFVRPENREPAD